MHDFLHPKITNKKNLCVCLCNCKKSIKKLQSRQPYSMRFSSNAPTTPTTTTSIGDAIEANLSGKRGSMTTTVAPSHDQVPIQVVDLNGSTPTLQHQHLTAEKSSSVDKMQEIMNAGTEQQYTESPPLNDDDGNV